MSNVWNTFGCSECRDAWASLAKNVDRTVIEEVRLATPLVNATLFKCKACGGFWEEFAGCKGPEYIPALEAKRRYGIGS